MTDRIALQVLLPDPIHPAAVVALAAISFLLVTYLGYPLVMWARARLRTAPSVRAPHPLPSITCIVAAHDEGAALAAKVRNLLALDYPPALLDVVIADDGSEDGSPHAARALDPSRVRVASTARRMGKPSAITRAVGLATGEVVLLCDTRQRFERGAARALVAPMADPAVGVVTGQLRLESARGPGAYWRYEAAIRSLEGRCGSVVGATGAIYAARRELFPRDLPPETILDDVYVPMKAVLAGWRVAHAPDAVAFDREFDLRTEFHRKVRTLAGNYQLPLLMPEILNPAANPIFWRFFWHKIARLLCPAALLVALVATWLTPGLLAQAALCAQLACYVMAAVTHLRRGRGGRFATYCYTFAVLNVAAVWALWRFVNREARVAWAQTSSLGSA